MSITYSPELLPAAEPDDEVEVIIVGGFGALTAEELACGLGIRAGLFDGALFFRVITPEEFYAEFPPKATKIN